MVGLAGDGGLRGSEVLGEDAGRAVGVGRCVR